METVRIDRLRARYHGVSVEDGVRLDRALAELTETTLEQEFARAQLGSDAWAVCIAELSVEIELDPSSTRAAADAWARAIASALRAAAEAGAQAGVVVYPTRADAVIDLARGISGNDHRHEWAWRQVGLIATQPSAAAVRAALLREPRLAAAVLGAVGPEAVATLLSPADLAEVATRVVSAVGAEAVVTRASVPTDGELDQDAATRAVLVATAIPAVAWGWARLQSPEAVARLAVLAASIAAPSRARDRGFIASLVSIASGMDPRPAAREPLDTDEELDTTPPGRSASADRRHPGDLRRDAEDPIPEEATEREPAERADGPDEARTEWGGVWFLVHAMTELDVVQALAGLDDADATAAMTRLIASVTGAPADDPAVRWLAGSPDSETAAGVERPDRLDLLVEEHAAALRVWLGRRAGGRLADLDPDRLWRRRGVLRRTRGEIVLELSLDDVDTTVRIAGLDLDPGWVWWLGAFVRFRYV